MKRPPWHLDDMAKPLIMNGTGTPLSDFSWILGDEGNLTCMEKFQIYYLPKKLFSNPGVDHINEDKVKFASTNSSNASYKQRQKALGIDCKNAGTAVHKKQKYSKENDDSESDRE